MEVLREPVLRGESCPLSFCSLLISEHLPWNPVKGLLTQRLLALQMYSLTLLNYVSKHIRYVVRHYNVPGSNFLVFIKIRANQKSTSLYQCLYCLFMFMLLSKRQ